MEQLLAMSISASILILILLVLRRLCGRLLPRKCFIWLSMIVMMRLLLPVQIPVLPDQIPTVSGVLQELGFQDKDANTTAHVTNRSAQNTASNVQNAGNSSRAAHIGNVSSTDSDIRHSGSFTAFFQAHSSTLTLLWLCGALICGGLFLHRMWMEYGILRQSLPLGTKEVTGKRHTLQIPLYYSDQITSPVTFGILHYSIVLPKTMRIGEFSGQDYILLHECMHIRHRDNLRKMLALLCVCIHWFSPFVWIWLFLFYRDLELACDEAVLSFLGRETRESYALTLITFMEQNQNRSIMNSGFGQTAVKERIVSIMNYKKKGLLSVTLSAALLCSSLTVFAANKPADTKTESETESATQKNSLAKTQDTGNTQTTTETAVDAEPEEYSTQLTDMDIYYTAEEFSKTSFYTEYEKHGLSYDKNNKALMFDGKRVVSITDDYSDDKGLIYEDTDYLGINSEVAYTSAAVETISDENDTDVSSEDAVSEGTDSENVSEETVTSDAPESDSKDSTDDNIVFLFATRDKDWNLTGFDIGWDSFWTEENIDTEDVETSTDDTAATAIIGGADGPTSIFLAGKLGSETETEN